MSAVRNVVRTVYRTVNAGLHHLECLTLDGSCRPLAYPPIFIIGPPRCGSTLLYEALTECYDVSYLTNLHCRFYGAPSLLERVVNPRNWRGMPEFTSTFGHIDGCSGPSECGNFWYRFFPRNPHYVPLHEAEPRRMQWLRGAVRALGDVSGRPILFKNLYCTLRLAPIAAAFPEALFIVLRRDIVANAHSLLVSRKKINKAYEVWWSIEPPGVDVLKRLLPHEQVVEQIYRTYDVIDCERERIGKLRFIEIQYETFCRNPCEVVLEFDRFIASHNVRLERRAPLPKTFPLAEDIQIEFPLYERLTAYACERARHHS